MIRSCFFAAGLFIALWGVTFLAVDKLVLKFKEDTHNPQMRGFFVSSNTDRKRVFDPPDWAAFSLMSIGSVTMLYSIALPKRTGGH